MPPLPQRPDLGWLRRQAKDLLRAARNGDAEAAARIHAVSSRLILAAAQSAIAREHGFASWARLKTEVERRDILNSRDLGRLAALLAERPDQATSEMRHWCDHLQGASPLGYMAMLRFDARRLGLTGDLPGTGAMAQALIDAGAAVNGGPHDPETPLMTAASYGDAEVAAVLIANGADLEATASPEAGGVPGGTALLHAAVFGMTGVVDVLVAAGAGIRGIEEAAAAGDVTAWLTPGTPPQARIRALTMAADHQRLDVIGQLVDAGTPIDADDTEHGRQALRLAAQNGRAASVRRLLDLGADPGIRDTRHHLTALEWCRLGDGPGHRQVEALLRPVTPP
ncbi:ankyrin repeat domain-containing protein [Actinomadura scrupuli]|uniref:ankyrin repeat domain-containing protein n=1 Tax=Actinomadura scrupuli TaxID=559629 RepID=UPI003D988776